MVAEWGFVLPPKAGGSVTVGAGLDRLVQIMRAAVYSDSQKKIWLERGFKYVSPHGRLVGSTVSHDAEVGRMCRINGGAAGS